MTIVIPADYHAIKALQSSHVVCVTGEQALKEDIRAMKIGILNIMPEGKTYEFNLLNPLGRSVMQIIPIWIRLVSHSYKSAATSHLEELYITFDQAVKEGLDGLLITGAPVEKLEFNEVHYWDEIKEILLYCEKKINSTLGICWGGLAIAYFLGIDKENYNKKLFGIFETYNLIQDHFITGSLDDIFWLPQSRHAGINNKLLEQAKEEGLVNLLAFSREAGYTIFDSVDGRFLINLGHFEYNAGRLLQEYQRDKNNNNVSCPENFNLEKPCNRWRGQRNEFFGQWVKYCHNLSQIECN